MKSSTKISLSIGIFDDLRAVPGLFDRLTGHKITPLWRFLGDPTKRFPIESSGKQFDYGRFELDFNHAAWTNTGCQSDV